MSALALGQSKESKDIFEAGKKRKRTTIEDYPYFTENIYANKRLKMTENDADQDQHSSKQFQRGRFDFNQLGILRTKPGQFVFGSLNL